LSEEASSSLLLSQADVSRGLVRFVRVADRFAHRIELGQYPKRAYIFSKEGAPVDAWPASPPLQQLHFETLKDDLRVALLVGGAGKSYWSLSVSAKSDPNRWIFEAACRVHSTDVPSAISSLGSSYEFDPGCRLIDRHEQGLIIGCEQYRIEISSTSTADSATLLQIQWPMIRFVPDTMHGINSDKLEASRLFRWGYEIRVQQA
jgi:hypothetical protein